MKIDWHKVALWLFNALLAVLLWTVQLQLSAIRSDIQHVRELAQTEIAAVNTRLNDHIAATVIPPHS